ncbi:MAG: hypothetical protein ACI8SK_001367 [Shewanella sp.]|jgi:hypothetical protein
MVITNIQFEHNEDKYPLYIDILKLGELYQRFGTLHLMNLIVSNFRVYSILLKLKTVTLLILSVIHIKLVAVFLLRKTKCRVSILPLSLKII